MQKVYMLKGHAGGEGDYYEYNIKVFGDETAAELKVIELEELLEKLTKVYEKNNNISHKDTFAEELVNKIKEIDKHYTGYYQSYSVESFDVN